VQTQKPLLHVHVLQPSFFIWPSVHAGGAVHEPSLRIPMPASAAMQELSYVF
jgi:hypothetical protein